MMDPLVGHISWAVPDNHTISVTLFKDSRTHELEDKDWTFVIEDVSCVINAYYALHINSIILVYIAHNANLYGEIHL